MERRLLKNVDWRLVGLVLVLGLLGVLAVASATQFQRGRPETWGYAARQATWLAIGLGVLAASLAFDYHLLARWARPLYALNLLLLLAVRLAGREALGAQRWLQIGPIDLQPSEFAKVLLIVTLASQLSRQEGRMPRWRDLVLPALHALPPMLLVLSQPDLGTSLVFLAILAGMLYVGGVPGVRLAALGLGGLGAAVAAIAAHFRWGLWLPLRDYQLKRLIVFVDPESDPLGAGYHILQSKIAIGSGGLTGHGLFAGTQNQLNYLPEQHTDFIFAVIGEEWGFLGGALVILLYLLIVERGIRTVAQARDQLGALLAAGVVAMLAFQVLINIGMTMGVMPVTGIPLPFLSYGGSSLIANSVALGILLNVHLRRRKILF